MITPRHTFDSVTQTLTKGLEDGSITLGPNHTIDLKEHIRKVPDFPSTGITFWDITPLLGHPQALQQSIDRIADRFRGRMINKVAAPESRGFLFGPAIAKEIGAGFVPIRKAGKLPRETVTQAYMLEYGEERIQMHTDAIQKGDTVLFFDDVLATGGTSNACASLIERQGGEVSDMCFLIELQYLTGRQALNRFNVFSVLQYTEEDLR